MDHISSIALAPCSLITNRLIFIHGESDGTTIKPQAM